MRVDMDMFFDMIEVKHRLDELHKKSKGGGKTVTLIRRLTEKDLLMIRCYAV